MHGLSWNEEDGFAEWEENDNARVYQVKLYRNDVAVGSTRMTKNTTYDFSEATSKSGRYRFMVRAVGTGSERGAWETSEIWHVLADEDQDLTGGMTASERSAITSVLPVTDGKSAEGWEKDETGWWYRYADDNYPSSRWAKINGKWYFFDENGYMKTGWIKYKTNGITVTRVERCLLGQRRRTDIRWVQTECGFRKCRRYLCSARTVINVRKFSWKCCY